MAPPQGYAPVATTEYEPDSKPAVPQVPVAPAQAQGIPPEQPQVLLGHPVLVRPQGVHKGWKILAIILLVLFFLGGPPPRDREHREGHRGMQRPGPHPWGPGPHGRHGPGPHPHGPKPPCVKKCMEEVAEVKAECATKMRAIKLAFEAGKITKDQALAKFEVLKQECAEEFEDVFEKCGPHPGPKPHDGPMDLVAMFHNVFGSPEAKSPECDAAIDDMKASCAPTDWKTFDWSKCAEASKRLADKCAKVPPEPEPEAFGAKPSGNPDCDAAIAEMDDACAASDDKTAVYDWKKCADASKKIAKACSKWGPKPPEDAPEALEAAEAEGAEAKAKPADAACDAALEKMRDACAGPAKDAKDASPYDWKKCADASKAIGAACAKPGPKPEQPFNFLACVAQAKMTESECSYDVQTNLAKEDKFDAYIDAFEQCEPSVDRLVQACQ